MKRLKSFINIIFLFVSFQYGFSQETEYPFAADIRQFKTNDSISPPPSGAILFVGSSSFTFWTDVQDYFPGYTIINRGFGGSTLQDLIRYAELIIIPYDPKQIVIYCGENDLDAGDTTVTGAIVCQRFITLFGMIREKLPDVKISYISMKPSPYRWRFSGKMTEGNDNIRDFIFTQQNASFISIWDDMLKDHHQPDSALFISDYLHMNARGYAIWQEKIGPHLVR